MEDLFLLFVCLFVSISYALLWLSNKLEKIDLKKETNSTWSQHGAIAIKPLPMTPASHIALIGGV